MSLFAAEGALDVEVQSYAAGRAAAELATARRFESLDCTALSPTRFAEGKPVEESLAI